MGGCGRGPLRRLLAALLLALLLLARPVWAASQSQKNRRWDRVWKTRRKACAAGAGSENHGIAGRSEHSEEDKREEANKQDKEDCAALHPDENDNCVNRCTSPACYAEVYAASPLEPGEKQALLECPDTERRAELLTSIFEIAAYGDGSDAQDVRQSTRDKKPHVLVLVLQQPILAQARRQVARFWRCPACAHGS